MDVDVDDYGTLALDDLAAFVERGPRAFYNAQALPGKSIQLPKPPGSDSQRFGRVAAPWKRDWRMAIHACNGSPPSTMMATAR